MQPLDSIVVLDLHRRYPGAYSAMILGDFGAQVIKIDPPDSLFPVQGFDTSSEGAAAYLAVDRNKKSIILNLKEQQGKEILYTLVQRADVFMEGFRPGTTERLGIDYAKLRSINPRLIYCSTSGFGQGGPYARRPAHDANYCALAGALSLIGQRGGQPYIPGNLLADMAGAGLNTVIGILLGLLARSKTGDGQFIDISYLDGVLSLMTYDISAYYGAGLIPRRGETALTGGMPWYNVYKCLDGEYFSVACAEPHFWANFCHAIGKDNLIPLQYPDSFQRDTVISVLADVFLTKTRDEWEAFFKDKEVCVAPVNSLNEALDNPQVIDRQMTIELHHPTLGAVKQPGIAIKLSQTPGNIRSLGVICGTNTDEILLDIGYEIDTIRDFHLKGIVGGNT